MSKRWVILNLERCQLTKEILEENLKGFDFKCEGRSDHALLRADVKKIDFFINKSNSALKKINTNESGENRFV